jgi:hypothetical protein
MKGNLNLENKLTDIYLPRKCDFTDRVLTSKDHSSIQLSICDVVLLPLRSTPTAPSTSANLASSPFPASCDPLARATLPSRRFWAKRNSSDLSGYI